MITVQNELAALSLCRNLDNSLLEYFKSVSFKPTRLDHRLFRIDGVDFRFFFNRGLENLFGGSYFEREVKRRDSQSDAARIS